MSTRPRSPITNMHFHLWILVDGTGLLNLRGSDLEFSPLFFAHVIVTVDRKVYLHLAKSDRFTDAIYNHCYMEGITVIPKTYDSLLVNIHEVVCLRMRFNCAHQSPDFE